MTDKFTILKKLLKALGLSEERVEEFVAWIETWLQDDREEAGEVVEEPQAERYPYHLRDNFLSPAEHHFFRALLPAVSAWAVVCPKVRLGDIFYVRAPDRSARYRARNRIERKHLDFLLCDPETMQPLLGVELNDRSHQRADRRKRDGFVAGVFDAAGLPIAFIKQQSDYDAAKLGRFLHARAGIAEAAAAVAEAAVTTPAAPQPDPQPPPCPQCGATMVQRTAKSGANAGKPFWGCPNFPQCRGIVAFV